MYEMYTAPFKLQMLFVEATAATTKMMSENYLRFLEQQAALFQQASSRARVDDGDGNVLRNPKAKKQKSHTRSGGKVASPCCGADLHDHYGKRNLDVDVERI